MNRKYLWILDAETGYVHVAQVPDDYTPEQAIDLMSNEMELNMNSVEWMFSDDWMPNKIEVNSMAHSVVEITKGD